MIQIYNGNYPNYVPNIQETRVKITKVTPIVNASKSRLDGRYSVRVWKAVTDHKLRIKGHGMGLLGNYIDIMR